MAKNLTDTINAAGQTGQVDEQEQQALAEASAGIMTPVGGAGEGLNPDQAKMLGTSVQKDSSLTSAIRHGIQEDMDLATAQRRSDWTRQVEKQPGKQDDVTDWAGLADISSNVQQQTDALIQQQIEEASRTMNQEAVTTALGNFEVASQFVPEGSEYASYDEAYQIANDNYNQALEDYGKGKVSMSTMATLAGKRATAYRKRWEAYQADGAYRKGLFDNVWQDLVNGVDLDTKELDAVATMLGLEGSNRTPTKIREALGVDIEEIEFSKDITAADLGDDALLQNVADTLGKPLSEIQGMSVYELQNAVEGVEAEAFSTGTEMQRAMNDPALGDNERMMFAQAFQDYGAISGEKAELEFDDLMKSVEEADTIKFGDQKLSVEEIFEDGAHTRLIAEFFDDEETEERLRNDPEFAEFVQFLDKHSEVLEQMTASIDTSIQEGEEMAQAGQDARTFNNGTEQIPDNVFETFLGSVPDFDNIQDQSWMQEMEASSLYQAYRDPKKFQSEAGLTEKEYTDFMSQLGPLNDIDPTMLKYLAKMPPSQLGTYLLEGPDGLSQLDRAIDARHEADALGDLSLETEEEQAAFFRSLGGDSATLQKMLDSYNGARHMGIQPDDKTAGFLAILDQDGDGQLDDPAKIQQQIAARGDTSFRQVLEGGKAAFGGIDVNKSLEDLGKQGSPTLMTAISDGVINVDEVGSVMQEAIDASVAAGKTSLAGILAFKEKYGSKLSPNAQQKLEGVITREKNTSIANEINAIYGDFSLASTEQFNAMEQTLRDYTAQYGEDSWIGYKDKDPKQYADFRKFINRFEKITDAELTVGPGMSQETSDYLRKMRDIAVADREKFTKNFRAVRDRKNIWKLLNTAYKPPKLVSIAPGHEITALQDRILSGEQELWYG